MLMIFIVQFAVCFFILKWVLKKKTGAPFSRKAVTRFLILGAISMPATLILSSFLPLERDTFFGMNPILSGFLTALITAALLEETVKYIFFRLAVLKNGEVVCWQDAIIAAISVGIGFTLMEDLEFAIVSDSNIIRAIMPMHLLFQGLMGYFYGKARVTKDSKYDVLSLVVPILWHTLFDMFLIGMMSIIGNVNAVTTMSEEEISSLPYYEYAVPMMVCAIAVMVISLIALILFLRKVGVWSRTGEKQEQL